jgi:hypothetical protein
MKRMGIPVLMRLMNQLQAVALTLGLRQAQQETLLF